MKKQIIIAIDGPAASGKSTTAKLVAQHLGYLYVDTGAMYRAATLLFIENNVDLDHATDSELIDLLKKNPISLKMIDGFQNVFIGTRNVNNLIRTPEVTAKVSAVAGNAAVRNYMVHLQQVMGKNQGTVMDGRDIGTVVFPNAELKIFMKADVEERAKRRQLEFQKNGIQKELAELIKEIEERDYQDSTREHSPLKQAKDAVLLDTSHLTIEEQVNWIVNQAEHLL